MTERKVVGRNIVIITGVACIVLAVSLVVALIAYLPTSNQINSLNTQLSQNNQTITSLNAQIATLNSQISSLNQQNSELNQSNLQNEIDSLNLQIQQLENVLTLNAAPAILVNGQSFQMDPNSTTTVWDQPDIPLIYAGYVTVQVQSSNSNTTFAEVSYNAYGVAYNNIVKLGSSGSASFPVLPGNAVIMVGNTEPANAVTATVLVSYYY